MAVGPAFVLAVGLARLAETPSSSVTPVFALPTLKPTPILALLLLLSVFCSKALRAACSRTSPSALSTALPPADRFEPVTVMSEFRPAPWAMMVRSLPAATVEPAALDALRSVVLVLCCPG